MTSVRTVIEYTACRSQYDGPAPAMPQRVVVLGSLNMDLVVEAPRLPVAGETVLGGRLRTACGGKGANQAVAAARLGARVSMIGCTGTDSYGRDLRAALRSDGVNLRHVRRVAAPTGVALIVVEPGGENLIAVAPGANALVTAADVAAARARFGRADVVVAQLEVSLEAIAAAAAIAHGAGIPFVLNAAPAQAVPRDLLAQVEVLVVNESELGVLVGRTVAEGDEANAARALREQGPARVVVTLGARGALLADDRGDTMVPSVAVEPVDTTAAGDAFVGALAGRYRGADSFEAAARYAAVAGALACTRAGAQPSLPTLEEVERLLEASSAKN
jgi:ribokinase